MHTFQTVTTRLSNTIQVSHNAMYRKSPRGKYVCSRSGLERNSGNIYNNAIAVV